MKLPFAKPGSTRVPAPMKMPRLGDSVGKMPQKMSGGRLWHSGPGVVTNLQGHMLHPDTVAERARRGLPPYREPVIGAPDPDANDANPPY